MIFRRVLYWSAPLGIVWIWIFEEINPWLQQRWQARVVEASATRNLWLGSVAIDFTVLALAALGTHAAFFFKHSAEKKPLTVAWSVFPHLLLGGVLMGTSMVLRTPGVLDRLAGFGLSFLGSFLFYAGVVWSLMATLSSLLPSSVIESEKEIFGNVEGD
jgi:hypothetical protein